MWVFFVKEYKMIEFSGECFDIGTHEALAEVNELYSK